MDKSTFDLLNQLATETDELSNKGNHIFLASDSVKFIETYIIEFIEFYNNRYTDFEDLKFSNIEPYIPFIKILPGFELTLSPFSMNDLLGLIKKNNENLSLLIENTDLIKKFDFPLKLLDKDVLKKTEYLEKPLTEALKTYDVKTLISYSNTLFLIPSELEFITIFFGKNQTLFINYFETIGINPFENKAIQIIGGENKEIYKTASIIEPDIAMSIDNLAEYHKKTKRRNIDVLVKEYKKFYDFLTDPDNYKNIKAHLYKYCSEHYSDLCDVK